MNYTVISNVPIKEISLSAEALGMLVYLYSQPDDWRVSQQDLARRFKLGRNKIYAILNELIVAGYIIKQPVRAQNGRFLFHEYIVDDEPQSPQNHPLPYPRDVENRDAY